MSAAIAKAIKAERTLTYVKLGLRSNSGSFATLAAIRRALSFVMKAGADTAEDLDTSHHAQLADEARPRSAGRCSELIRLRLQLVEPNEVAALAIAARSSLLVMVAASSFRKLPFNVQRSLCDAPIDMRLCEERLRQSNDRPLPHAALCYLC
jgi:hypothetical protein